MKTIFTLVDVCVSESGRHRGHILVLDVEAYRKGLERLKMANRRSREVVRNDTH